MASKEKKSDWGTLHDNYHANIDNARAKDREAGQKSTKWAQIAPVAEFFQSKSDVAAKDWSRKRQVAMADSESQDSYQRAENSRKQMDDYRKGMTSASRPAMSKKWIQK